MLTPPIFTVIVSFPGAAGAVYVVVHTPWLHATALNVPPPGGGPMSSLGKDIAPDDR